ncbi:MULTISPECIES: cytochrome P450 [Streptomyces]|uniref:Cytochrome P450 n=1 Tax=Streptomyces tsukubensis (strain DSM 42081 / NBRC 108919 / NRRL 18488 / 9993) TaxID=1114943 RepID=A0A7G3ULC0_STRT9|nr:MULTISPECIES: cytochrome P450 [Streptomyces]MYS65912.1 cytochrome P450 [Streptomyces sp. SID5473]QKM71253.1 cytochrome P450 [Streptomyces tsukubensis NRRL18488]TAI40419.1 cytochrome P450 [Streptomyces tsukubensis]
MAVTSARAGTESVPRAPGALPLVGHAFRLWRDPLGFLGSLYRYGDLVRLDLGTLPVYAVTSSELVHQVLTVKGRSFEKGRFYERLRPLAGNGLATADGEYHRRHRRLMQPMFSRQRIAGYSEVMSSKALELAGQWRPGMRVDVERAMSTYAVETLAATMFSTDFGRPAVAAVRDNLPVLLNHLLVRAASPRLLDRLPIRANRDFDAAAARLRAVIDETILAARAGAPTDRDDLLTLLLTAQEAESGERLDDTEVRDELSTILFAGVETTTAALTWTLTELARHPEAEAAVAAEVRAVVGGRPVTVEDVPKLPALRRALDEAMRLHGVTLLMRRAVEPVELAGRLLPPGTELAFSLYAIHRDGRVYENPDAYDPDRWLPERQEASGTGRTAYLPFGAGARKCIGDQFTYTEATIALATILDRWKLEPAPGAEPRQLPSTIPRAQGSVLVVRPRE